MPVLFRWIAAGFVLICLCAAGLGWAFGREAGPAEAPAAAPTPGDDGDQAHSLTAALQGAIQLQLPISCRVGQDCQIQNYVDRDPGPGVQDYRCGVRTYEGHTGTDFRILDMTAQRRGVDVVSALDGVVSAIRDGEPDVSVRVRGAAAVAGQECGNGVMINHADGLSTQYCHMAEGSIRVQPGETVRAGTVLGRVGVSGNSEYPHLHFTVRRQGTIVDPFNPTPGAVSEQACAAPTASMWSQQTADQMRYLPRVVLNSGASSDVVTMEALEAGTVAPATRNGGALVFYVRAIGLQRGDVQTLIVRGPDGAEVARNEAAPLTSDRAQQMIFAGNRSRGRQWAAGTYQIEFRVTADGRPVLERAFPITLAD